MAGQSGQPSEGRGELAPLEARLQAARGVARDPRIVVTALEAALGAPYTFATISYLRRRCPGVHFVWLMGADNLPGFHRWKHWRDIAAQVPICVIDRPGSTLRARASRAGQALARYQLDEAQAGRLATAAPPAFVFLHGPRSPMSSTALRAKGRSGQEREPVSPAGGDAAPAGDPNEEPDSQSASRSERLV